MSHDSKLVYMANQIGKFFETQGPDRAVAGTAEHIKKFWDPRMLSSMYAYLEAGGGGLAANVRQAFDHLREAEAKN
jgi:formate dehydrogenase subunit delta